MVLDVNALGSLSATLDDLTARIGQLADGSDADDEAVLELREVERQLQATSRRLATVLRRVKR